MSLRPTRHVWFLSPIFYYGVSSFSSLLLLFFFFLHHVSLFMILILLFYIIITHLVLSLIHPKWWFFSTYHYIKYNHVFFFSPIPPIGNNLEIFSLKGYLISGFSHVHQCLGRIHAFAISSHWSSFFYD